MSAARIEVVLDTNVAVASNGKTEQAGLDCVASCVAALGRIMESQRLLVDDLSLILGEYMRNLSMSGQPGPGDRFLQWLWRNQANERHCRIVKITPDDERGFAEFPDDPSLAAFDPDDRKFAAVAIASGARILNASDTDWWIDRHNFRRVGVEVEFLCPDLMRRHPSP